MVRLSALVCVQNGEAHLAACLRSLSFCDEIVVVADRCTDRTQEIARRAGAQVVDGIFPLASQRKAAGADACTGHWILEIEPDEQVVRALAWEVRAALQMRPVGDWFELPIDNYVGETLVRRGWTGALSAERAPRLYRRGVKAWRPGRLDDAAVLSGAPAGALKGAIRRAVGADVGQLVERLNRQARLRAEDLADAGRIGSLPGALGAAAGRFLQSYLLRRGWREGRLGFLVALLSGLHPVLVQMQAREALQDRRIGAEPVHAAPLRQVAGAGAR